MNTQDLHAIRELREALRTMNKILNFGDRVYDVRERECKGWDGPEVSAYSAACAVVNRFIKESPLASEVPLIPIEHNTTGEACPACGSLSFAVARDMHATRRCIACHKEWLPGYGKMAGVK